MTKRLDPRLYQIGALTLLLLYGLTALDFDTTFLRSATVLSAAIGAQALCSRIWKIAFDPRSAAISGLSLSLLLRSNSAVWLLAAATIAVGSKFVIRWRGKHIFNPTNIAIVALMLMTSHVWVSPGQWGNVAFFGFLITCLGGLVVNRASRSDVTYAFIIAWSAVLIGRSLWLGEPLTIPLHRLQNGALLLFTFFMVSDPKTTPNSRVGRILFAILVASGAWYVQFKMFHTNAILWSLAATSLVVPLIDLLLPAEKYEWFSVLRCPLSVPPALGQQTTDNRQPIGGLSWSAASSLPHFSSPQTPTLSAVSMSPRAMQKSTTTLHKSL